MFCDIGTRKGEKVDYVIKNNDDPVLIIPNANTGKKVWMLIIPNSTDTFTFPKQRFGVLTNGIIYNFIPIWKEA